MARFRTRLCFEFGEIEINYDSAGDLEAAVRELGSHVALLDAVPGVRRSNTTATGYEDLASLDAKGVPRLSKYPSTKGDAARLVLFLSASPLDIRTWEESSGVANPLAYVDKKELIKTNDGRYSLGASARARIANIVIPQIRAG